MTEFDQFVHDLVLHNELASPDDVAGAAKMKKLQPGKSLLDILIARGAIDEGYRSDIDTLWEDAQNAEPAFEEEAEEEVEEETEEIEAEEVPAPEASGGIRLSANSSATTASSAASSASQAAPPPPPPANANEPIQSSNRPTDVEPPGELNTLQDYLLYARKIGATDLHISAFARPHFRMHGELHPINDTILSPEETHRILTANLTDAQRSILKRDQGVEFCYKTDAGRYRSSIVEQRTGTDGAFRVISNDIPTMEQLGLGDELKKLTAYHQGLVLITGPNGCGKSTTMAAMIENVNRTREEHVITIEDPIETVFIPNRSQINQRESGTHTKSYGNALRAALREDPDVIMIGELRDRETISLAITAAETGHLVFGTLHTTSAARTIDRLLDVFPPGEQAQIRSMISESIKGIICQQLLPKKDAPGRQLVMEILFNNPACASLIRERKLHQIPSVMQMGAAQGMCLFDTALERLVNEGKIEGTEAWHYAENKELFLAYAPDYT